MLWYSPHRDQANNHSIDLWDDVRDQYAVKETLYMPFPLLVLKNWRHPRHIGTQVHRLDRLCCKYPGTRRAWRTSPRTPALSCSSLQLLGPLLLCSGSSRKLKVHDAIIVVPQRFDQTTLQNTRPDLHIAHAIHIHPIGLSKCRVPSPEDRYRVPLTRTRNSTMRAASRRSCGA